MTTADEVIDKVNTILRDWWEVNVSINVAISEIKSIVEAYVAERDDAKAIIMVCPKCGSQDLDTLEMASCVAVCDVITPDGPVYNGWTDYERGGQETVGVICNKCSWEYEGDDWLSKLIPSVILDRRNNANPSGG